jgi:hypothetical protein
MGFFATNAPGRTPPLDCMIISVRRSSTQPAMVDDVT